MGSTFLRHPEAEVLQMGRRPSGALPVMRRHRPTNTARIVISGKVYSLGRWGSDEARMRFDTFIAAYVTSGRTSVDAARAALAAPTPAVRPATALRAAGAPVSPPPAPTKAEAGLTVGELAARYLRHIQETKPKYRDSSLWQWRLPPAGRYAPSPRCPRRSLARELWPRCNGN